MRNKLAVAGFILSLFPLLIGILFYLVFEPLQLFRGESTVGFVFMFSFYVLAPGLGLIFGIISLIRIRIKPKLEGKGLPLLKLFWDCPGFSWF